MFHPPFAECRPCTQCTFMIPSDDPYRTCMQCRKEARDRARKRRVRTDARDWVSTFQSLAL
ncbi:hypothetical protein BD626DRAFT_482572 [Schizophyllum amplum]|uniref:Uncharacterized protein n=1 Tax=Schizophyllum amplum TaxID=97359 RepID=A0A550CVB5_9AGAR|nr:hypothetical protein BD626DRAFT_482572 [Auriculariopsis ampla]